jgi:hypothetical protein
VLIGPPGWLEKSQSASLLARYNSIVKYEVENGALSIVMLLSVATALEVESQENGGFWLEAEIVVPEGIFTVELVLDAFGSGRQIARCHNRHIVCSGSIHSPSS